jgi:hypothetical protein
MTAYIYFEVDRCCGDLHGHPPSKLIDTAQHISYTIISLSNNFWVWRKTNIGKEELIGCSDCLLHIYRKQFNTNWSNQNYVEN